MLDGFHRMVPEGLGSLLITSRFVHVSKLVSLRAASSLPVKACSLRHCYLVPSFYRSVPLGLGDSILWGRTRIGSLCVSQQGKVQMKANQVHLFV